MAVVPSSDVVARVLCEICREFQIAVTVDEVSAVAVWDWCVVAKLVVVVISSRTFLVHCWTTGCKTQFRPVI
jgi:hypothetical protein